MIGNRTDALWQHLLDEEMRRWRGLPVEELIALERYTEHHIEHGALQFIYGLWHENPTEWHGLECHSFILQTSRQLFPLGLRKYLAGFAINGDGNIEAIADRVLYSYD